MANVYSPESLGIKPPAGGFAQGGWYSGRQYWGGTLSDPGVIHPSSSQVGSGQSVSPQVVAQTNPANVGYIEQQKQAQAKAGIQPTGQITPSPSVPTGAVTTGAGAGAGAGFTAPETINLPKMYESLYGKSGIKELEAQLSQQEKSYIEAKGKINDNPFLSEATRVGRVAKIEQLYNERTANVRGDIATKKADIETQLNLQMKQFDINSQAAQQALSQFNTLLGMGALDNASGEDIANITRSTGISSQAIYSAIEANKAKNVQTSMQTFTDNSGNVTAVVINSKTGDVISKTSLGNVGPAKTTGTGGVGSKTVQSLKNDIENWYTLQELAVKYSGVISQATIVSAYNAFHNRAGDAWGPATESQQEINAMFGKTAAVSVSQLGATDKAQINQIKDWIKTGVYTRDEIIEQFPEYAPYI